MSTPVIGIGTDLVEVARIRTAVSRTPGLKTRIFTPRELEYSSRYSDPHPRLAARFAAKEAAMKALGVGIGAVAFREIELFSDGETAPSLALSGSAQKRAAELGIERLFVSISHTENFATATVVAQ